MLQNIVFQDNIYQLSRSIDIAYEGLMLELSEDYFLDKTIDDLLFFDMSLQKIHGHIQSNTRLSDFVPILHGLYSCEERYLKLLDAILKGKTAMQTGFAPIMSKLQGIRNAHASLKGNLVSIIQKSDKSVDSRDIVSQNELSELLNF